MYFGRLDEPQKGVRFSNLTLAIMKHGPAAAAHMLLNESGIELDEAHSFLTGQLTLDHISAKYPGIPVGKFEQAQGIYAQQQSWLEKRRLNSGTEV